MGFVRPRQSCNFTAGTDFAGPRSTECGTATRLRGAGVGGTAVSTARAVGLKAAEVCTATGGMVLAGLLATLKAGQYGTATKGHNINIPVSLKGSRSLFLWYSLIAKSVKK